MIDREVLATIRFSHGDLNVEISVNTSLRELPELLAAVRVVLAPERAPHARVSEPERSNGRDEILDKLRSIYVDLRRRGLITEAAAPTRARVAEMSDRELIDLLARWRELQEE